MIFPVDERTFLGQDLHLLESMEFNQRVKPVQEIIEGIEWQGVDPDLLTRSLVSCFNCFSLPLCAQFSLPNQNFKQIFVVVMLVLFNFVFLLVLGVQSFFSCTIYGSLKFELMIPWPYASDFLVHILFFFLPNVALSVYLLVGTILALYSL